MVSVHNASIKENICLGFNADEIDNQEIWAALEAANLREFVETLPDHLNFKIDDLGSNLLCIKMKLDEIKYHKEFILDVNQELDELITLTSDAIVKNRATSHLLMPESLKRYGLESSFKDLLKHYERLFNFTFNCDLAMRLPFLIEINVYRIVSELLSNSAKHSKATEISLWVSIDGDFLDLKYSDNGQGFDFKSLQKTTTSLGLSNIKNRVSFLNGELDFDKEKFVYCIKVPIS
jgi:signal transduction histidine kinase